MRSNKVGLIYSEDYSHYNFGKDHPLRPLRLELTFSLAEKLGLIKDEKLVVIPPRMATTEEIERVHAPEYVNIVKILNEDPTDRSRKPHLFGLGPGDNPIFKGIYDASALVCGASIIAADKVWNDDDYNVCFNISGGLHHALRNKASGFCIFNDIAVAIKYLKTLKKDIKVAYLDIDCHHGDGVQWIFYDDPDVLTISLHESGRFLFPGTGEVKEIGEKEGEGYSINFPLLPGTTNKMYLKLFRATIPKILEAYAPDVLITQLGADIHYKDPLTQMGLSLKGIKDLAGEIEKCAQDHCNNKWVALGGGGYWMNVVPRAWNLFLAKMMDIELKNELPESWRKEVKEKAPTEGSVYLLWDRGDEPDRDILSNPIIAKKMIDYNRSLIETCENVFLPKLSKT